MDGRVRRARNAFERRLSKSEAFDDDQVRIISEAFEEGMDCMYKDILKEIDVNIREIASTNWRKAKEY